MISSASRSFAGAAGPEPGRILPIVVAFEVQTRRLAPPRGHLAMQEHPSKVEGAVTPAVDHIEVLAQRLRDAEHLGPDARAEMADLLRSLALELERGEPSDHEEHLAHSTVQLVRAVSDRHEPGLIEAARNRLDEAITKAEAKSSVATDIVARLADLLAGIGI